MRAEFTDDQRSFAESVCAALTKHAGPDVLRAASRGTFDDATAGALTRTGVFGVAVPEAAGGAGGDVRDIALVVQALGWFNVPLPVADGAFVGAHVLTPYAAQPRVADLLTALAQGSATLVVQPEAGRYVPHAQVATHLLTLQGTQLHLVAAQPDWATAVVAQDRTARLARVQATLSPQTLVADSADAVDQMRAAAWTADALIGVGLADRMLDLTVSYVKERTQFGRPIGSFQAAKHQLADLVTEVEAARGLAWRAAHAVAREPDPLTPARIALGATAQALTRASRTSLQLHGGIGFTRDHDLHLWILTAQRWLALVGDPRTHRQAVAARLLRPKQRTTA